MSVNPELPKAYLDTHMPTLTGNTVTLAAGDNLQRAINKAVAGDTIILPAGAVFTGNFVLTATSGPILIRSSSLTPEGVRVSPSDAANMPKLISPNADPAIKATGPVGGYRLVGIEIGVVAGWPQQNGLVVLGDGEKSLDQLPHDITIDRCYIHGNATGNVTRGITGNCKSLTVIDSYIGNIHGVGYDTQAICGWNGPGPFRITNNYLEASGENIMFGGADSSIAGLNPSDIEIRRNTLNKPLTWNPLHPSYAGVKWSVKNLFELKNAKRVLVDGNVMENCWVDAQVGVAIQLTPRNQDGNAPWSTVEDVTISNNIIRHVAAGVNILGTDNNHLSGRASRIAILNNLFDDLGAPLYGGNGRWLQITAGAADLTVSHNTTRNTAHAIAADTSPAATGFTFTNNLEIGGDYGVFGSGQSEGNKTLTAYFPGAVFVSNALIGRAASLYPTGNYFPSSEAIAADGRLAGSSPLKGKATDGKDIGVDVDALLAAMNGVGTIQPPPSSSPSLTLTLPAGGVEIVIRDKAGNVLGTLKLNP